MPSRKSNVVESSREEAVDSNPATTEPSAASSNAVAGPDTDLTSSTGARSGSNGIAWAQSRYDDVVMQYQVDLQCTQARINATYTKLKKQADEEHQQRWLEAYREFAQTLVAQAYAGPHVEEANAALQRLSQATASLQDTQDCQKASQEAASELTRRIAEADGAHDATDQTRQAYCDYLAQLAHIWERSEARREVEQAQHDYQNKLASACDVANQRYIDAQQRYLDAIKDILNDDTAHKRIESELHPMHDELARMLERAQRQCLDATIEGLRAYASTLGRSEAAAPA